MGNSDSVQEEATTEKSLVAEKGHSLVNEPDQSQEKYVECVIELKLRLRKEATGECLYQTVSLTYPRTTSELKNFIEDAFQIPVSQQKLYFASRCLSDKQSLLPLYLRTGDEITVEYAAQAKVIEISRIIRHIQDAVNFLEANMGRINEDWSRELHKQVRAVMKPREVESLMRCYFLPHMSEISDANRLYFVHNNGLESTVRLHEILSACQWECMPLELQCMERATMVILWNLSATLGIRYLLLNKPDFINNVCKSIVRMDISTEQRVRAPAKQRAIADYSLMCVSLDTLLIETMFKGMGIITNISEIPLCQIQIASKPKVLQQMSSALLSPSFNVFSAHIIISAFLNLSYNPETHSNLTTPLILEGVIGVHKKESIATCCLQNQTDMILLRYYTTLFFALICTTSTAFVNSESFRTYSQDIAIFINSFFQTYTSDQVQQAEKTAEYFWSTLKPFVDLVYLSFESQCRRSQLVKQEPMMKELHTLGIRAGIFLLNNACKSEDSIKVLENEGQIDFIVWYIDEIVKDEASTVVRSLSLNKKLNPPRLCNIAKARLATFSGLPL